MVSSKVVTMRVLIVLVLGFVSLFFHSVCRSRKHRDAFPFATLQDTLLLLAHYHAKNGTFPNEHDQWRHMVGSRHNIISAPASAFDAQSRSINLCGSVIAATVCEKNLIRLYARPNSTEGSPQGGQIEIIAIEHWETDFLRKKGLGDMMPIIASLANRFHQKRSFPTDKDIHDLHIEGQGCTFTEYVTKTRRFLYRSPGQNWFQLGVEAQGGELSGFDYCHSYYFFAIEGNRSLKFYIACCEPSGHP